MPFFKFFRQIILKYIIFRVIFYLWCIICLIKQDIRIYVPSGRPIGRAGGKQWVAWGWQGQINRFFFFFKFFFSSKYFFSHGQRRTLELVWFDIITCLFIPYQLCCTRPNQMYQSYSAVPELFCCTRPNQMYQTYSDVTELFCCTRPNLLYQTYSSVPDLLCCTRTSLLYQTYSAVPPLAFFCTV